MYVVHRSFTNAVSFPLALLRPLPCGIPVPTMSPQGIAGCLVALCLLQISFLALSTGQVAEDLGVIEALRIAREAIHLLFPCGGKSKHPLLDYLTTSE